MSGRRFSLESVLTVRNHRTVEAAAALAAASRIRMSRQRSLESARADLEELEAECARLLGGTVRAGDFLRMRNGIELGRERVAVCAEALRESLDRERVCREVLLSRQAEEEAVSRLKEKHREALKKESLRLDERASDEFVSARRSTAPFSH